MTRSARGAGRQQRVALFVTYTMANPAVVGVFFRAIRVSLELTRRGWLCVICNCGPLPTDPKVEMARQNCRILSFDSGSPANDFSCATRLFREIAPDIVIFGEDPLPSMEALFQAARALGRPPLLLLEQLYSPECIGHRFGVDAYLLYGVRSPWPEQPARGKGYRIIPPFIEEVLPVEKLSIAPPRDIPWITVLGFDERVLRGAMEIISALQVPVFSITLSHQPLVSDRMMQESGIPADRRVALPLQPDPHLFGYIAASRTVILANGFMQMVEAIALGCPAVCVNRGVGMNGWSLNDVFRWFVSFEETHEQCVARVHAWLKQSPFSSNLFAALQTERGGVSACADAIEETLAHPRLDSKLQRWASRLRFAVTSPPLANGILA